MPQGECGLPGQIPDARCAGLSGPLVDLHDLSKLCVVVRFVGDLLVDPRNLEARLDGDLERRRKLAHILEIDGEGSLGSVRFLVQLAGKEHCLTT